MLEEIKNLQLKKKELEGLVSDPGFAMSEDFIKTNQKYSEIKKILEVWENLQKAEKDLENNEEMIEKEKEQELVKIAKEENKTLKKDIENYKLKIENFISV